MKITNASSGAKPATAAGTGRAGAKGSATPAKTAASTSSSSNAASAVIDPATRLSQLEAQFAQADFNAGKVGEVTDAIAAGRYKVNSGAVADKLIESSTALGRKSGGNS
jgi:flagellar biosynthesis anti-sigma factor FlgM